MSSSILTSFRDAKTEIPDIKFTIPSTGEDLFLRPFTTREQKSILKAMEKEDPILMNEAFDQLINNCVVTNNFNSDNLLTKDRDALLIKLRQESVKDDFTYHWTCSDEECGSKNSDSMSLTKLKFKPLKNKKALTKEVKLSDRNIKLILKLPTLEFEKMLYKHISKDKNPKKISAIDVMNTTLAISISEMLIPDAEGKYKKVDVSFADRVAILDEITIDDKKKVEKFLNGIEVYGFDLNLGEKPCKECKTNSEVELDWTDFFLM